MDVTYRRVSAYARNMGAFFVGKKVYVYDLSWHIDILFMNYGKMIFFCFCFVFTLYFS